MSSGGEDVLLLSAAQSGNHEFVLELLNRGISANCKDHAGETPLHRAAQGGHAGICLSLLDHQAVVNAQTITGETALHYAARTSDAVVELLLLRGANPLIHNAVQQLPIHFAASANQPTCIGILCNANPQSASFGDSKGLTPLMIAAQRKATHATQALLHANADVRSVDVNGFTCLHHAAHAGSSVAIRMMTAARASTETLDKEGASPLLIAIRYGRANAVAALLEGVGAAQLLAVDGKGRTALHYACELGTVDCVSELLNAGADPTARDNTGRTPAHVGAEHGHGQCIAKLATARSTQLDARDGAGATPLHIAAANNDVATVEQLIAVDVDVDVLDAQNRTPLIVAAASSAINTVRALLFAGASVHAQDDSGRTAKDYAVDDMCRALLEQDDHFSTNQDTFSDVGSMNTPLNLATENTVTPPLSPLTVKTSGPKSKTKKGPQSQKNSNAQSFHDAYQELLAIDTKMAALQEEHEAHRMRLEIQMAELKTELNREQADQSAYADAVKILKSTVNDLTFERNTLHDELQVLQQQQQTGGLLKAGTGHATVSKSTRAPPSQSRSRSALANHFNVPLELTLFPKAQSRQTVDAKRQEMEQNAIKLRRLERSYQRLLQEHRLTQTQIETRSFAMDKAVHDIESVMERQRHAEAKRAELLEQIKHMITEEDAMRRRAHEQAQKLSELLQKRGQLEQSLKEEIAFDANRHDDDKYFDTQEQRLKQKQLDLSNGRKALRSQLQTLTRAVSEATQQIAEIERGIENMRQEMETAVQEALEEHSQATTAIQQLGAQLAALTLGAITTQTAEALARPPAPAAPNKAVSPPVQQVRSHGGTAEIAKLKEKLHQVKDSLEIAEALQEDREDNIVERELMLAQQLAEYERLSKAGGHGGLDALDDVEEEEMAVQQLEEELQELKLFAQMKTVATE